LQNARTRASASAFVPVSAAISFAIAILRAVTTAPGAGFGMGGAIREW
jgi:hypothetical protein